MIPMLGVFESHLNVSDLQRSMAFFGGTLGLELAHVEQQRKVAFYWVGGPGKSMLGLWETGTSPLRVIGHTAFAVELKEILAAPVRLRAAGITPLDFNGSPTTEPSVLAWMPAASLYFHDPDGNLLEFLCMLPALPQPELGVLSWTVWNCRERSQSR
jgi:lactoylglutathione lyase